MKKILLILLSTISMLGVYAQDSLYVYRKGGHIEVKSVASVDSIKLNQAKDSLYVYQVGKISKYELSFVDSISFQRVNTVQSVYKDKGVVINGVCWATRNVGSVGKFVTNTQDYGYFYCWNSKIGYPQGNTSTSFGNGINPPAMYDTWTSANDPSPAGWKVPTHKELSSLNSTYVSFEYTTLNGVPGGKFTDKATGASMFLPAVGYRVYISTYQQTINGVYNGWGWYWFNEVTVDDEDYSLLGGRYMRFHAPDGHTAELWDGGTHVEYGLSIRPVIR
jgi:hypothetical protein